MIDCRTLLPKRRATALSIYALGIPIGVGFAYPGYGRNALPTLLLFALGLNVRWRRRRTLPIGGLGERPRDLPTAGPDEEVTQ